MSIRVRYLKCVFDKPLNFVGGERLMLFEHLSKLFALVFVKFRRTTITELWSKTVDSAVVPATDPAARGRRQDADTRRRFGNCIAEIDVFNQV